MSLGRCVKSDLGYLGCAVDVLGILDARCSGQTRCSIQVEDDELYETHPCPEDTTSYLQTSFSCVGGELIPFFTTICGAISQRNVTCSPRMSHFWTFYEHKMQNLRAGSPW